MRFQRSFLFCLEVEEGDAGELVARCSRCVHTC